MSLMPKLLLRIYRVFLLAYPRTFRADCSHEMMETVRARHEDVRGRSGHFRMVRFWSRELTAVGKAGVRLRVARASRPSPSVRQLLAQCRYDLRFALRTLRHSAAFSSTAVLTIALGIGATTVIFSFVHAILLSPLPYEHPDCLVRINTMWFGGRGTSISEPEYYAFRTEARSLESVVATLSSSRTLLLDEPRRLTILQATHELFPVLGVAPLMGRMFNVQDESPGAAPVAIMSHWLWSEMFGEARTAVGTTINLDGRSVEVIGVMPPEFRFPTPEVALWTPYALDPANLDYWNNHYLRAYARLAEGVALETARVEVQAMGERFVSENQEYLSGFGFGTDLIRLFDDIVGGVRATLLVLLTAVGFLLLIGCSNVANLLLARGETRKQEIAVRAALGASRGRVMTQLLTESVVLALLGGLVGSVLAPLGVTALRTAALDTIPRVTEVAIDLRIVIFTSMITILTGLVFGLLPALTASRSDLNTHLKEFGRTSIGSRRSNLNRRVLVAIEVALSVILVIGAGVMLRSLGNLRRIDPGFRTEDVLTMRLSFPDAGAEVREPIAFYEQVLEEVRALPGVTGAGVVSRLPLSQGMGTASIQVEGRVVATIGEAPGSEVQQLTPGYIEAMDVTILEGRGITAADNADNRPVVLVHQAFATLHWPGESAIGRRIKLFAPRLPWLEIVGIVGDVRHNGLLAEPQPKLYIPHSQSGESAYGIAHTMNVVVHAESVERLAGPIRSIVSGVNSAVPVYRVQTMKEVKSAAMVGRTYPTLLLTVFGLLALFLASIGIYGLVVFQVNQGKHDIGIHMALGATRGHVRQMVVGKGLFPVILGIAVGLMGAFGLTRMLNSLLYEVSPLDLPVYLGVSTILLLVAATASLLPAVGATRLDPVEVLRSE